MFHICDCLLNLAVGRGDGGDDDDGHDGDDALSVGRGDGDDDGHDGPSLMVMVMMMTMDMVVIVMMMMLLLLAEVASESSLIEELDPTLSSFSSTRQTPSAIHSVCYDFFLL